MEVRGSGQNTIQVKWKIYIRKISSTLVRVTLWGVCSGGGCVFAEWRLIREENERDPFKPKEGGPFD
jgi:hypothetical protein